MTQPTDILQKTNVTLKMLIESNVLTTDMELVCRDPSVHGNLNQNGTMSLFQNGREKVFHSLSAAAKYLQKTSINGWIYWSLIVAGQKVPVSVFRDKYIESIR